MNTGPRHLFRGFSLVEVTITIGIAAFCLLSVVGLLPLGLGTLKSAQDKTAAALALNQISQAIRSASEDSSGAFSGAGAYSNLSWPDGSVTVLDLTNLSLSGLPAARSIDQRLAARVKIDLSNTSATGAALISVAWPAGAKWNEAGGRWDNAQGSLNAWVVFTPRK